MATHQTLTSLFSDIADAIRAKTGENRTLVADEFPDEIAAIPSGGGSGYSITVSGSHFTYDAPSTIGEDNIAEISFTPESGYELSFAVTGATLRNVDYSTYKVLIENPTGAVSVTATAVQPDYFWVENIGTSSFSIYATNGWAYSKDKSTWTTSTQTVQPNEKLYYKGWVGKTDSSTKPNLPGSSTSKCNIGGNAYTLLHPSGIVTGTDWSLHSCFSSIPSIVDASELTLDEDVLTSQCYYFLFYNCPALTAAPELPATTLTNNCYGLMFYNCTSLTSAPSLPATNLADYCYVNMFQGCSALTTAPELPATNLVQDCYNGMFRDCTALKVYSESGEGHDKAWTIPSTGTATNRSTHSGVFDGVQTDSVPETLSLNVGEQRTYYTQNTPV